MPSPTKEEVVEVIKTVYDPEIPVNVYDLGLVYDVDVEDQEVNVVMTLTSPSCPSAKEIPMSIEQRICGKLEVERCLVHIVWTPPWGPHLISPEGKKVLGIDEDAGGGGDEAGSNPSEEAAAPPPADPADSSGS